MKLKVLASSSKGNCYILEAMTGSLLLECGIAWKMIKAGLDFDLSNVVGVVGTHAHLDHMKSAKDVIQAGIDIYMGKETIEALNLSGHRIHAVEPLKQFSIGSFTILGFPIEHDVPGLGYLIQNEGFKLLFLTDSYYCKYKFAGLNAILIECNYCKDILDANIEAGLIDEGMKRRLLESHMSLEHCKDFLRANDLGECRKIVLLHLSEGNSSAARMKCEVEELTGIETVVAEPGLEVELDLYPY